MIVCGGVYEEVCDDPASRRVLGSGLRAAGLLARRPDTVLVAPIDSVTQPAAQSTAAGIGATAELSPIRIAPVQYIYDTPVSRPSVWGDGKLSEPMPPVRGDAVLLFGLHEGPPDVAAPDIVVDPQHSLDLAHLATFTSERLVIVANEHELASLTGINDPMRSTAELMRSTGATAVVAKLGALGTLVRSGETQHGFLWPEPTASSWAIGSGDAFSAGFASAWFDGASAYDAARSGRAMAAWWCSTTTLPAPDLTLLDDDLHDDLPTRPRIYIAAPFFDVAQRWLVRTIRAALHDAGAHTFSPMEDVGIGGPEVAQADLAGLAACDAVLAVVDDVDAGTLFEVGWATANDVPVVIHSQRAPSEAHTMPKGTGSTVFDDLSSAIYAAVWAGMQHGRER